MAALASAAVLAALCPTAALGATAWGTTGDITRADASPDWLHGSIAGYVQLGTGPATLRGHAFVTRGGNKCDSWGPYSYWYLFYEHVWTGQGWSERKSFDIADFQLSGSPGQHLCLYEHIEFEYLPDGGGYYTLLADRLLTVPRPPLPSPPPPQAAAEHQGGSTKATLSRTTVVARAKAALKRRFGGRYERGKRKRLRCVKRSSTRYRCAFSFHHRKQRKAGNVIVRRHPNGTVTATIKLTSTG